MATTEYILHSLTEMDRFVRLMAAATGTAGVVDAVSEYLAGWSKERILNLQKFDAGWSPFDDRQQPVPMHGAADVLQICRSVRNQCIALKQSGIVPAPELLELDRFFFFARQIMEDCHPASSRTHAEVLRSSNGSRPQRFGGQYVVSAF